MPHHRDFFDHRAAFFLGRQGLEPVQALGSDLHTVHRQRRRRHWDPIGAAAPPAAAGGLRAEPKTARRPARDAEPPKRAVAAAVRGTQKAHAGAPLQHQSNRLDVVVVARRRVCRQQLHAAALFEHLAGHVREDAIKFNGSGADANVSVL